MNNENAENTAAQVKKAVMDTGRVTAIINSVLDKREPELETRIMTKVTDIVQMHVRDGVRAGMEDLEKSIQLLSNKIELGNSAQSSRISNVERRQNTSDEKVNIMESEIQITKEGMLKQGHTIEKTRDDVGNILIDLRGDPDKTNDHGMRGAIESLVNVVTQLDQRIIANELWQNNADRYIEILWRTVKASAIRAWSFRGLIVGAGLSVGVIVATAAKIIEFVIVAVTGG